MLGRDGGGNQSRRGRERSLARPPPLRRTGASRHLAGFVGRRGVPLGESAWIRPIAGVHFKGRLCPAARLCPPTPGRGSVLSARVGLQDAHAEVCGVLSGVELS